MEKITIRTYKATDFDQVVDLMYSLQDHFNNVDSMQEMKAFDSHKEADEYFNQGLKDVNEMDGVTLVAEKDSKLLAFIQGITTLHQGEVMHELGHVKSKEGWIGLLYVDEKSRGLGIGRELLNRVKEFFETKGCNSMRLLVMSDNTGAVDMYSKFGFKPKDIEMVLQLHPQTNVGSK